MGFLDKAIRNGVGKAIGNAVGSAVEQGVKRAVQPTVNQAANQLADVAGAAIGSAANKFGERTGFNQACQDARDSLASQQAQQAQYAGQTASSYNDAMGAFGAAMGTYVSTMQNIATSAAANMKVCPKCQEPSPASQTFCPHCGTKLPDHTLASETVCPQCGTQNTLGMKFCAACGSKLPTQLAAEAADQAVLAKWNALLSQYPVWNFGGSNLQIDQDGTDNKGRPIYHFFADGVTRDGLAQYVTLLKQNGFVRPNGSYSDETLYRDFNGVCYAFNQTDAFDGNEMCISFFIGDYNQPKQQPQQKKGFLGGLFG